MTPAWDTPPVDMYGDPYDWTRPPARQHSGVVTSLLVALAVALIMLGLAGAAAYGLHRQCQALKTSDPARHAGTCAPTSTTGDRS